MSEPKAPTSSKRGSKGLVVSLLIILVVAAVAVYYVKKNPEALDTAKPEQVAQQPKDAPGGEADLPMFAPKGEGPKAPVEPQSGPQAPEVTGQEQQQDSAQGQKQFQPPKPVVTMQASPADPKTDRILTLDFVDDLASYLAANFHPAGTRHNTGDSAMVTATFKKLNMRYGVDLRGMNVDHEDAVAGRKQALDHLLSPTVLRLAYGIFAQDFAQELAARGLAQRREFKTNKGFVERPLTQKEVRTMLELYAGQVSDVGRTLAALAGRQDLTDLMGRYAKAVAKVNDAYSRYSEREASGASDAELDAMSMRVQEAITVREDLRTELLSGISLRQGAALSNGDVVDIAGWVYRRLTADPESLAAVGTIAALCKDFSKALLAQPIGQ